MTPRASGCSTSSAWLQRGLALVLVLPLSAAVSHEVAAKGPPAWLQKKIAHFQKLPLANPPRSVWRTAYEGQPAYYLPAICCDIPSELYNARGQLLCYPSGGFAGGDGRCPGFNFDEATATPIWQDRRPH
jgi:hypothetical protein